MEPDRSTDGPRLRHNPSGNHDPRHSTGRMDERSESRGKLTGAVKIGRHIFPGVSASGDIENIQIPRGARPPRVSPRPRPLGPSARRRESPRILASHRAGSLPIRFAPHRRRTQAEEMRRKRPETRGRQFAPELRRGAKKGLNSSWRRAGRRTYKRRLMGAMPNGHDVSPMGSEHYPFVVPGSLRWLVVTSPVRRVLRCSQSPLSALPWIQSRYCRASFPL